MIQICLLLPALLAAPASEATTFVVTNPICLLKDIMKANYLLPSTVSLCNRFTAPDRVAGFLLCCPGLAGFIRLAIVNVSRARIILSSTLALAASALVSISAQAQPYSIAWYKIAGGGGMNSTGGVFQISGTIGQPDASQQAMTGGNYSISGGFWSVFVVQTIGAPTLRIVPASPGQATLSWAPSTPGFVLQETLNLSPTNWVNSASVSTNPVTVPANGPTKFYRLFKP